MLAHAGITTERKLRSLGPVAAYVAVQRAGAKPSLNLLWALAGALSDGDWKAVAKSERLSLLTALDDAQRSRGSRRRRR